MDQSFVEEVRERMQATFRSVFMLLSVILGCIACGRLSRPKVYDANDATGENNARVSVCDSDSATPGTGAEPNVSDMLLEYACHSNEHSDQLSNSSNNTIMSVHAHDLEVDDLEDACSPPQSPPSDDFPCDIVAPATVTSVAEASKSEEKPFTYTNSVPAPLAGSDPGPSVLGIATSGDSSHEPTTNETLRELLCCPITMQPMKDPVVAADGQTYERSAIELWLKDNSTSPLTGEVMAHKAVTCNYSLRDILETIGEDPRQGRESISSAKQTVSTTSKAPEQTKSTWGRAGALIIGNNNTSQSDGGHEARESAGGTSMSSKSKNPSNPRMSMSEIAAKEKSVNRSFNTGRIVGVIRPKNRQLNDFTAIALKAYVEDIKKQVRWRSQREQNIRWFVAWFFSWTMYFVFCWIVLIYGVQALGPASMSATIMAWLIAILQVFLIIEPLQVCFVALFPFCVNEETTCGRCFRRLQWCYNEVLAP